MTPVIMLLIDADRHDVIALNPMQVASYQAYNKGTVIRMSNNKVFYVQEGIASIIKEISTRAREMSGESIDIR
jgi:uncharacterized protein YlzI (FlbEa/FlbD family)